MPVGAAATGAKPTPSFGHALVCFLGVFLFLAVGLFLFDISIHTIMFFCLLWTGVNAKLTGRNYIEIRAMMSQGIFNALPAIYIFILIGMVIASFMHSGTIASLIYYGLDLIDASLFLAGSFVLCSAMSVATGTSWGTVGTMGVVLIGIGSVVGVPLPMIAGAVVSGATFGDKLSPISDTTNLAAMSAGTDLYRHIGSMLYTTVPTFVIVLLILLYLGSGYSEHTLPEADIAEIKQSLASGYSLNPAVTLLPLATLLLLGAWRFAAEVSMVGSILVASLIAIVYQDHAVIDVLNALWSNSPGDVGNESLNALLGRGGIMSMAWTLFLSLMALALGGILHGAGFLKALLLAVIVRIKRVGSLVTATIASGFIGNMGMGEAYISIILNSQLFSGAYEEKGLDKALLSRSVEEGSTLTTGIIPWTTAGAFYAATLGVPVLDYAPYAFLNFLNPVVSIVMAFLGVGLLQSWKPEPSHIANKDAARLS